MEGALTTAIEPQRRGTKLYLVAATASQVFALLRYVVLARLLGAEQLGLAATLVLTQSFFNSITDMAADRFLIQDKDGSSELVQRFIQLVLVIRGSIVAACMLVFAYPLALFYKAPQIAPALAVLGIFPLIGAFIHLDMRRAQRDHNFHNEGISAVTSEAVGLLVTGLAAYLTRSYVSVIFGIIARSLTLVICSHLFSQRKYGWAYSREHALRLAKFSTPLMITGLILFFAGQGDRLFVARSVGFSGLGHYSAILLLIFYPLSSVQKFAHTIYLPLIAASRDNPTQRSAVSNSLGAQTLLIALCASAGFALVAPFAVPILYGKSFVQSAVLIALIGVLQAARFLVLWPTTVALAMGRSQIVLANNVLRLLAWPAALIGVALNYGLAGIVFGFICGELLANAASLIMLNMSEGRALFGGFHRFAAFLTGSITVVGWTIFALHPTTIAATALAILTLCVLIGVWLQEKAEILRLIWLVRARYAR